jgi:hypothetical protein
MQSNKIITANKVIYQKEIFPGLKHYFGYLINKHEMLLQILDLIDLNAIYPSCYWNANFGRPPEHRHRFVIAFLAKSLWNIAQTNTLIEYLKTDRVLRTICGFDERNQLLPSESTFSRSFKEISDSKVGEKLLEYIIIVHCSETLQEHVSIDGSAIAVAEKAHPAKKIWVKTKSGKKKRVVENKNKNSAKIQLTQDTATIINNLSKVCDYGTKKDSKGYKYTWKGYKLHVAVNDYNIPVAAIVTSASVNDTLVAIPLIRNVEDRIDNLYYLMDAGYDATAIRAEITNHGKVGLIDFNHRGNKADNRAFMTHEKERYGNRSFSESLFSHLKMQHLPSYILYRGIEKVQTVLHFALSIIATLQIIKYSSA